MLLILLSILSIFFLILLIRPRWFVSFIFVILFFQPRYLFSLVLWIYPGVTYFIKTNKKVVAITIDDGPDEKTTPKILETISSYDAKVTFFLISSKLKGNENIITSIINDGHEIGNHLTEDKPSVKLTPEEFERELLLAHKVLLDFTEPHWLRPASGWYTSKMLKIAQKYGYQVALGSVFPYDTHIASSWYASIHILANVRPGSIIVLHDCGSRGERTNETLNIILPKLRNKGYDFVTLSQISQVTLIKN